MDYGRSVGARLRKGDVVLLFGPLGSGKTTLVTGLAAGLGISTGVVSPTYTLLEVYDGPVQIFHFDFYRLSGPQELRTLDPREYYDLGVTVMEWPERMRSLWPEARLELHLEFDPRGRWVEDIVREGMRA